MEQKENKIPPASILDIFNLRKPIPFKESNLLFYDNRGLITFPPETHRCQHSDHVNICKTKKENKYPIEEMYVQKWDIRTDIISDIVMSQYWEIPSPIIICKECCEYEMRKKHG
jgi:hypothetical protein